MEQNDTPPPHPSTIILTSINLNETECWRRPWLKVMPVLWQIFPRLPIKMPQPLHVSWIHVLFRANWTKNHQIAPSCYIARVQRPTCTCTWIRYQASWHYLHDLLCLLFYIVCWTSHRTCDYSICFCFV